MTDPHAVFEDLAADHLGHSPSGRRRMFGRDCLTHHGHNVAFLDVDRLAVKLPPTAPAQLLASGEAIVPCMGQRAMQSWVSVALPAEEPTRWATLLSSARAHALGRGEAVAERSRLAVSPVSHEARRSSQ